MNGLTIFGGHGFVGSAYVKMYYDQAIGNVVSVNDRKDYTVHSKDVLYLISTVHNYHVFDDVQIDIDTNLKTLVMVLEDWRDYQEKTGTRGVFNFVSSWFVYGQGQNVLEVANCDPKGFYSITKRCAEQLLVDYCNTHGLKYRILRLANVIGHGDKKTSSVKNSLQFLADKISNNEHVHIHGDGHYYRDYIHKDDCARAIELVITKGKENEIYNIGNGPITWDYVTILSYLKKSANSTSEFFYELPKYTFSFTMDNSKLKALGYEPKHTYGELFQTLLRKD